MASSIKPLSSRDKRLQMKMTVRAKLLITGVICVLLVFWIIHLTREINAETIVGEYRLKYGKQVHVLHINANGTYTCKYTSGNWGFDSAGAYHLEFGEDVVIIFDNIRIKVPMDPVTKPYRLKTVVTRDILGRTTIPIHWDWDFKFVKQ